MGSSSNPSWPPFQPTGDCSKVICSKYCPQWCFYFFPPPPPFDLSDDSSPTLSPLVIALIALAAVALILIAYYTIIHRHRRRRRHHGTRHTAAAAAAEEGDPAASPSGGLEESLINNITVCRYRRGSSLVDGTGCSVCLAEFKEDESLRMLPKCCHAFHLQCIDTWLKSHPNCPLCRAGIVWVNPPPLSPVAIFGSNGDRPISENRQINEVEQVLQDSGTSFSRDEASKDPSGDPGGRTLGERYDVVEIREDGIQPIRRSSSIDVGGRVESSEGSRGEEDMNSSRRSRVLPSDMDPSSINQARVRSGVLPV